MKTRRRFLLDFLCLGGVLVAASQVQPFFAHFLVDQDEPSATPSTSPSPPAPHRDPAVVTKAYPSDSDRQDVTEAYPSDSDKHIMTQAYPSDRHVLPPRPEKGGKQSGVMPLWRRLS